MPKRTLSNSVIADFKWVQDEPCSTMLMFKNTLPFELNVTSIKLLTDGVPFESTPKSLRLDQDPNMSVTVHLTGIPKVVNSSKLDGVSSSKTNSSTHNNSKGLSPFKQKGSITDTKLILSGYSTHLLGVKSDCKIDMLPKLADSSRFPHQYLIEVTPPLPHLEFINMSAQNNTSDEEQKSSTSPHIEFIPMDQVGKDYVVMIYNIKINRGDKQNLRIPMKNADDSSIDIEYINIILAGTKLKSIPSRSVMQQQDNSGDKSFQQINANLDIVANVISWDIDTIDDSLPIKIGQQSEIVLTIDTTNEKSAETVQHQSGNNTDAPQSLNSPYNSTITTIVIFEYSGGRSLATGFCRKSAIKFNIELIDG